MDWLQRMRMALDYLEDHMDGEIEMSEAAQVAFSSPFHFQRMFHMLTGYTVAEYVRCRRLSLAAQELASSRVSVLDVALKYGYDTPESFSKAFRKLHGLSPSGARASGAPLKHFPRISFQISIKGDRPMNYRIEEKPAFTIAGKSLRVSTEHNENQKTIPEFWRSTPPSEELYKLMKPDAVTGKAVLGVCTEFDRNLAQFTYVIAVEIEPGIEVGDYRKFQIPAANWVVFECIGPLPEAIQSLWGRIFSEFFPSSGYEHAPGGPEIEVYTAPNVTDADYRCEVWIPIIKK